MKILITGISSFIGSGVAKKLLDLGHTVYGIVRANSNNMSRLEAHDNLYLIQRDMKTIELMNPKALPKLDLCLHFAWEGVGVLGRMDTDIQNKNIENTLKLIEKCKELGVKRFVFAGSQAEYGQTLDRHIEEKCDELVVENPLSLYGKAKLKIAREAAKLCKKLDIEYIHLRIFSTYGYFDHETSLTSTCIKYFREDKELALGECKQKWNYIYIEDCINAILSLSLEKDLSIKLEKFLENKDIKEEYKKYIFNIASEDTRILKDFALEIAKLYGKEQKLDFIKKAISSEGIPYLNPDISKLKAVAGFTPKFSFKEGVGIIEKLHSM